MYVIPGYLVIELGFLCLLYDANMYMLAIALFNADSPDSLKSFVLGVQIYVAFTVFLYIFENLYFTE